MSFITDINTTPKGFSWDAWGRQRVSTLTTLFDGKTLWVDDTDMWDNKWTGTFTFNQNMMNMAVTAWQYTIRQSKVVWPYFSGKSQLVEITTDGFANEAGLIKRLWYFNSSSTAPYTANLDGYYLESNWDTSEITLNIVNNWTSKLSLDWTLWDNYELISSYDWDNFTVTGCDFLWLWWAVLRFFLKTDKWFVLAHTFNYAWTAEWVFMQTPNQPVRYELRSTTGAWNYNAICSQTASEWSSEEGWKWISVAQLSKVDCNVVDTVYALWWIRKSATYRDIAIEITDYWVAVTDRNDPWLVQLRLNPTVAWTFTYSATWKVERAVWASSNTVTNWTIIATVNAASFWGSATLINNTLKRLLIDLDDVASEIVLCYIPLTTNQDVYWYINYKEF